MQLRCLSPVKKQQDPSKIEHQIDNEGCKCQLCQRIVFDQMMVIRDQVPNELQEEKKEAEIKKDKEQYFIKFLEHLYVFDRNRSRLRLLVPQICLFDKGTPQSLFSKKKDQLPLRLIRNKEKLNFYEIKNFFYEGFTYHNRCPDVNKKDLLTQKPKSSITHEVKDKEALKNEPIVIARFLDNHGQMLSLNMMDSLFKYNQKLYRQDLLHIQTLVSSKNYHELRIKINVDSFLNTPLFNRAKNEVRIIHEEIKEDEFGFVGEREEFDFEDQLMKENNKKYLDYVSLKLLLLNSLSGYKTIWDCCFKFVKGNGDYYYFVDLEVYGFAEKQKIWGYNLESQTVNHRQSLKERPLNKEQRVFRPRLSNLEELSNDCESQASRMTPVVALKSPLTTISNQSYTSNIENLLGKKPYKIGRALKVLPKKNS